MTAYRSIEPHLYVREGARVTSYFTKIDGKSVSLGRDLTRARAALAELMSAPATPDAGTVAGMCRAYIKEQRALIAVRSDNALHPTTVNDYEDGLERCVLPVFGHMAPGDIRPNMIAKYLADSRTRFLPDGTVMKGRPVRANREMAALASAFQYGMEQGMAEVNPCRGVKRNKERPRNRRVSIAEVNAFLAFARSRGGSSYMVALVGCLVGLTGRRRADDILALPLNAISDAGIRVTESKTKPGQTPREFLIEWSPLLRTLMAEVKTIPRGSSRYPNVIKSLCLFPTNTGAPYTDPGFKCLWNRLMHAWAPGGPKSAEWFTAHDLRAFYVTEMMEAGRAPNTHRNEATMARVYDRRKVIGITPLA